MRHLLLAASAAALACGTARAELPFSFDRTPGKLPKTVVPSAYRIDLVPDLTTLHLTGREMVDIDVRQATDSITLNANALTLGAVTLEHGEAAKVTMDADAQTATLHFARKIAPGHHVLRIAYSGPIPETPAGIYHDDYKTAQGPQRMLVTQFEVADARRMFPGWDEPAFKARFSLGVTLPAGLTVISNMPAQASKAGPGGMTHTQFATTPRMSTYLLVLMAGKLEPLRGSAGATAIAVWAPAGEQAQGRYALDAETELLPYYNSYFGTPFPLPKLDLIAVPGNFDAGAMENWGGITFIDDTLLFDEGRSSPRTRETIFIDVSHEMAHQWSGDLVTMGWWDNIWLNEGFATWMENKATDHFNPAWEIWPRAHQDRESAMTSDARPTTHAIQQVIRDESEANAAFDEISYQKGGQVIRMIEDWLGPDTFRDGMRVYMREHAYSNTTSADLWAAMEQVAHKPVGEVATRFTEQPGIPLIHVATACAGGATHVTLTQSRFTIHDPNPAPLTWQVPVTVGGPSITPQHVLVGAGPASLDVPGCGGALKANFGEDGYYRSLYDDASFKPLAAAYKSLAPVDRADLLGDQFALFQAGTAPIGTYLDLLRQGAGEQDTAVLSEIMTKLDAIDALERGATARPAWRRFAASLLAPALTRLGWEPKPGESFLDAELRPQIIGALGNLDDPGVIAEAQRRFAAFEANPESLAPSLRDPVVTIIGHHADAATWEKLRGMAEAATSTEEKLRYFVAMASAQDPALIDRVPAYAASGKIPNGRVAEFVFAAAQGSDDPDRVWHDIQPAQAPIRAHLSALMQPFLLPAASGPSADPAIADALLADPASHANAGATYEAKKAADAIRFRAELRTRAQPAIAAWLHGAGMM